jgi:hypothetical protein
MTLQALFWLVLAIVFVVGAPMLLVWSAIEHFRGRGSERQGSGGVSAGVMGAMQELDRLIARPSIEHQVETEHHVRQREDDAGGTN